MIKKLDAQDKETRENMRGGTKSVHIRHYFKKEEITAPCRLCSELIIPSGASVGTHEHIGEDEIYLIQKGNGIIIDGGIESRIEAGDAVLTGNGSSHSIKNSGTEDLVVTAIIMEYPKKG